MAISKVVYGATTLVDLTNDTITADGLVEGYTAHDAAGNLVNGANPYEKEATDGEVLTQEQLLDEIVTALAARCVVTEPILQSKTVTPTEEVQIVTPDAGYDGLSSVTVEASQGGEGTYGWKKCVSRLPSGYTEVEYIESSGSQFVNSGVVPSSTLRVDIVFSPNSDSLANNAVFGSEWSGAGFFLCCYNSLLRFYSKNASVDAAMNTSGLNVASCTQTSLVVNGTKYTLNGSSADSANPIFLFWVGNQVYPSNKGNLKLYSCQFYDNNTLIRDFVPCTNASGTAGLYDLANGVFYDNDGSGVFAVGVSSGGSVVGYAVSDDANAYPDGEFLDGYYYEKL